MKKMFLCLVLFSVYVSAFSQPWKLVDQKDSFGDITGEKNLIGTFKTENKTLSIVLTTGSRNGESCLFVVTAGSAELSLADARIKVRTSTETIMLSTRNGFVTHGSAYGDSSEFIARIYSVDRVGNYDSFLDILKGNEKFRISIESSTLSGVFEIDTTGFLDSFNEMKNTNE